MSSIFKNNYIKITYKSKSNYPIKLCKYLIDKYNIKIGSKILDIGCGNGQITKSFQDLGMEVHGIDFSEESLNILDKKKFRKVNLSIKPYPFENETFDFIFCKSVIEHLVDPDILIDESYRLLKPNGIFICMTPSWKHTYKESFYIDHTHITPFTNHSLKTICELSGFKSDCEYFYQLPILWKYPVLNLVRFLIQVSPIPYRPFNKINWPENVNKLIRFSKEAMLICKCKK